MNSKLAKTLRKSARAMAASANVDVYRLHIEDEKKRKYKITLNANNQLENSFVGAGMTTNSPYSIRGIYREMKKTAKMQ